MRCAVLCCAVLCEVFQQCAPSSSLPLSTFIIRLDPVLASACCLQAQFDSTGQLWYSGRTAAGTCSGLSVCQGDDLTRCQQVRLGRRGAPAAAGQLVAWEQPKACQVVSTAGRVENRLHLSLCVVSS